ncbi:MAG: glycosyltransferase family 2 protein [Granulosicoccus sp.]
MEQGKRMKSTVSIVVPVYNEIDNIELALDEIRGVMDAEARTYEVVFVDDGSTDGSVDVLRKVAADERVKLVLLRRNFGQTAAMHAGIQHAEMDYIVTMDGDLQNDPASIPAMLLKLDEGYDLVHGWRKNRQDKLVSRKLPSWMANRLISNVTGFPIHDLGCTLKAIKSEVAKDIELYGEMHRFIPILANNLGAKCYEMEVGHRARQFGESKYGIGRSIRVLLDLITINYMTKYFASPMKLFGMFGFVVGIVSVISFFTVVAMKVGWSYDVTGNALTFFSIVCAILSIQLFSLGLIGELSVRIYYGTGSKQSFQVREFVNFNAEDQNSSPVDGSKVVKGSREAIGSV